MRTARSIILLLVLVTGVTLLGAGCGGDDDKPKAKAKKASHSTAKSDKDEKPASPEPDATYEAQVRTIGERISSELGAFGASQPTPEQMTKMSKVLDDAADDLEAVKAPAKVADEHADLVETVRDLSKLMTRTGTTLKQAANDPASVDTEELASIQKELETLSKQMDTIAAGYREQGYDLGLQNS